jgi:hypothetical protein
MSITVTLDELGATLQGYPWGYFVTVSDDARAHVLAVPTDWRDGALHLQAGRRGAANAAARSEVTVVFPGVDGAAYSLVVDGSATVTDDGVVVTPSNAVLHRPALSS